MELIATVELTDSNSSELEFASIPGTYTDLYLVASTRHNGNDYGLSIKFNGSTANISSLYLNGRGSVADSGSGYFTQVGASNQETMTTNTFSSNGIYIANYASTSPKSFSAEGTTENNATTSLMNITAGLFNSTSPITSISINGINTTGVSYLQTYTSASLYGIASGSDGTTTVT